MEFWVNVYDTGTIAVYKTQVEAMNPLHQMYNAPKTIKVREVLDD